MLPGFIFFVPDLNCTGRVEEQRRVVVLVQNLDVEGGGAAQCRHTTVNTHNCSRAVAVLHLLYSYMYNVIHSMLSGYCIEYRKPRSPVVLILDGYSEIGANVRSDLDCMIYVVKA